MRKLISICVLLALVCGLCGCCCITDLDSIPGLSDILPNREVHNDNSYENEIWDAPDAATEPVEWQEEEEIFAEPDIPETTPRVEYITMDGDTQYRINLFLSNFAEAGITKYPCCNDHMLRFVLHHCQINDVGDVRYEGDKAYFSKQTADTILNKYMGVTLAESGDYHYYQNCDYANEGFEYMDGAYSCTFYNSEYSGYVAVADDMIANADGTYTVDFTVYMVEYGFYYENDISAFYRYTPSEAGNQPVLMYEYSAVAVVEDYTRSNGQQSYQLLSLEKN